MRRDLVQRWVIWQFEYLSVKFIKISLGSNVQHCLVQLLVQSFSAISNARDDLNHNNQCSLKSMDCQQWRHEEVKPGGEYSQKLKTTWKTTFRRADDWNINIWLAEVNLFHFLCTIFRSNVFFKVKKQSKLQIN